MNEEANTIYKQHLAAEYAEKLNDALSDLVIAVWDYQDAHKPPKCCELDGAVHAAWKLVEQYGESSDGVEALFHHTGLEIIRLRQEQEREYWRKQEAERVAKQAKKAKPKTKKKAKAA
jgi:hypothetical protein